MLCPHCCSLGTLTLQVWICHFLLKFLAPSHRTLLHHPHPASSCGDFMKEALSWLFLLPAWGTAHRHRSWLCRPSSRRRRHSDYSPPRSRLHLHTFHPPEHTLLAPEIRDNSLEWRWNTVSWLQSVHLTLFLDKNCLVLRGTIFEQMLPSTQRF